MAIIEMPDGTRKRFPGVAKNGRRYYARVRVGKRVQYLGNGHGFDTPEEAHAAYVAYRLAAKPAYEKPKRRADGRTSAAHKMAAYLEARATPGFDIDFEHPNGDAIDLVLPDMANMHYLGFEVVPAIMQRGTDRVWRHEVPVLLWARDCRLCHEEKAVPFKTSPGRLPESVPATCTACAVKESAVQSLNAIEDDVPDGFDLV